MILAVFVWFFLPETRDRTLEEIHEMFEAKVHAGKLKGYVCVGVESYAAEATGHDAVKRDERTGAVRVNHTDADA